VSISDSLPLPSSVMVMESIDNLLKADSKNIKAYMIAAKIYKYYQM